MMMTMVQAESYKDLLCKAVSHALHILRGSRDRMTVSVTQTLPDGREVTMVRPPKGRYAGRLDDIIELAAFLPEELERVDSAIWEAQRSQPLDCMNRSAAMSGRSMVIAALERLTDLEDEETEVNGLVTVRKASFDRENTRAEMYRLMDRYDDEADRLRDCREAVSVNFEPAFRPDADFDAILDAFMARQAD